MKLLVFAHRAEAQAFLSKIPFKKIEGSRVDLYEANEGEQKLRLTICREGVDEALKNLTYILTFLESRSQLPLQVINLGVAGSVSSKLELSKIYSVRTSYRFVDSNPVFKSQTSSDPQANIDCISTNKRIIGSDDAQGLQVHGDIVDRELWGLAQACRLFDLPFNSYKLISDYAGQTDCELIADKGAQYSFKLWEYFVHTSTLDSQSSHHSKEVLTPQLVEFINQLSATFSQRVQLEKLFEACLKRDLDTASILKIKDLDLYNDWPRKKRNQFIINSLVQIADPVQAKLNKLCENISTLSCKAIAHTENPTVEIKAKISSQEDLLQLANELKSFPIDKLENFYQGNLDV